MYIASRADRALIGGGDSPGGVLGGSGAGMVGDGGVDGDG